MAELRTLHLTDIHDDLEKYEVIAGYIASKKDTDQAVNAVFITGDFIEGHPQAKGKTASEMERILNQYYDPSPVNQKQQEIQALLEEQKVKSKEDLKALDISVRKQLALLSQQGGEEHLKACQKVTKEQIEEILKPAIDSYKKHAEGISKIGIPVFAILGNHDLTQGYEILKDKVTFTERENKATITGRSGLEFIVKGDLNTFEEPGFYSYFIPLFKEHFIPYQSGYSFTQLSQEVQQFQAEIDSGRQDRLDKAKEGKEPKYTEEQLKELEAKLDYSTKLRKEVLQYNQAERQRLGNKNEADIYLTHKLPNCKKARSDIQGSLSDITSEYAANTNAVYGGHFHDGQIGYKTIENLLKQDATEKTTLDGVEVPIFYLDKDEPWELNPGTDYFFVAEYDANKKVEQVLVYRFVYQDVAQAA